MIALHCDRDGCDTWARTAGLSEFITITAGGDVLAHCCCLDCVTHWAAAHSEPTEVFSP